MSSRLVYDIFELFFLNREKDSLITYYILKEGSRTPSWGLLAKGLKLTQNHLDLFIHLDRLNDPKQCLSLILSLKILNSPLSMS